LGLTPFRQGSARLLTASTSLRALPRLNNCCLQEKIVEKRYQKQKITHLHYFIYTKIGAFTSRKIFTFIAPKPVLSPAEGSAFLQYYSAKQRFAAKYEASKPMFENPAKLCNSRP